MMATDMEFTCFADPKQVVFYYIFYKKGVNTECNISFQYLCIGLICSTSYQYMQMGFFAKSNKATKRLHEWESKGHEKQDDQ